MNSEVFFEGKKYISIKEASALTAYSKDYIGQLSRQGKINSKRIGKKWFVDEVSLLEYKNTPTSFDYSKNFQGKDKLLLESSRFIPISEASQLTGYSKDYIGQLARFGKVESKRDGKKWLVSESSVVKYKNTPTAFDYSKNFQGKEKIQEIKKETEEKVEAINEILEVKENTPNTLTTLHHKVFSFNLNFTKTLTPLVLGAVMMIGLLSLRDTTYQGFSNAASVVSSVSAPLELGGQIVYSGLNNLFDKVIYTPLSKFFSSQDVVVPVYVVQKETPKVVVKTPASKPSPIVTQTIITKTIEKILVGDVTKTYVDLSLNALQNKLTAEFSKLSFGYGGAVTNIYNQIANTQRIDNLYNTAISNPRITGGGISGTSITATGVTADSVSTPILTATTATITNLAGTTGVITNLSLTNSTTTNATTTNAYIANLVGESASTTNITALNFTTTNFTGTHINGSFATITSATTTNLFTSLFRGTTGIFDTLTSTLGNITGLIVSNSTTTNATTTNAFSTNLIAVNATTTNLFATIASSTNTYGTFAQFGTATLGNLNTTGENIFSGTGTSTFSGDILVSGLSSWRYLTAPSFVATSTTATSTFAGGMGIGTTSPSQKFSVTGSGYFTGGLGIGVATTAAGVLQTSGDVRVGGNLFVNGNSITLGSSVSDTLVVNSTIGSSLVPNQNIMYDLGSPSFYWRDVFAGNITVNSISAASTTISGTNSQTFTVNADNVTGDTEDSDLVFFRGVVTPNALLSWKSAINRFEFNQPTFIQNADGTNNQTTLALKGTTGTTADILNISSSTGLNLLNFTYAGNLGLGSTTPGSKLSVSGNAYFDGGTVTAANFVATSSFSTPSLTLSNLSINSLLSTNASGVVTATSTPTFGNFNATSTNATSTIAGGLAVGTSGLVYDRSTGNVGIGTASPTAKLQVNGTIRSTVTSGEAFSNTSGTTGALAVRIGNSSNDVYFGTEGNTAGGFFTGSLANSTVIYSTRAIQNIIGGTSRMIIDTSGNVGVGTSTPSYRLDVYGSSGTLARFSDGTTNTTIYSGSNISAIESNNALALTAGNSERVRILSTGNVGIGSTSPNEKLSVAGNAYFSGTGFFGGAITATSTLSVAGAISSGASTLTLTNTTGSADFIASRVNTSFGATYQYKTGSALNWYTGLRGLSNNNWYLFNNNTLANTMIADALTDEVTFINKITVPYASTTAITSSGPAYFATSGGNVGIGTTNPGYKLQVNGNTLIADSGGTWGSANLYFGDTNWGLSSSPSDSATGGDTMRLRFYDTGGRAFGIYDSAGSQYRMVVKAGNVGIGTASPGWKLDVLDSVQTTATFRSSNTGFGGIAIRATDSTFGKPVISWQAGTTEYAYDYVGTDRKRYFNVNGGDRMTIDTAGNVGIGASTPNYKLQLGGSLGFTTGATYRSAIIPSAFGYSGSWKSLIIGATSTIYNTDNGAVTVAFGYDPAINSSGAYSGDGREIIFRNGQTFMTPNATDNGWHSTMTLKDGSVGIGTANPQSQLEIYSSTGTSTLRLHGTQTSGSQAIGQINFSNITDITGGYIVGRIESLRNSFDNGADLAFSTAAAASTPTERMRIDRNGNIGIGTTTPTAKLDMSSLSNSSYKNDGILLRNNGGLEWMSLNTRTNLGNITIGSGSTGHGYFQISSSNDDGSTASVRMRIDNNGNMGIGTTTPGQKLSVAGDILGNNIIGSYFTATSTTATSTLAGGLAIGTNYLNVLQNGNVGIGTAGPTAPLQVFNSTANTEAVKIVGGGGSSQARLGFSYGTASSITGDTARILSSLSAFDFVALASQPITFTIGSSNSEKMRIHSDGNVGIGTSTPDQLLTVSGNAIIGSGITTGKTRLFIGQNILGDKGMNIAYDRAGNYASFQVNGGDDVLVLKNSGNVGIGTTTPLAKLSVRGSGASTGINFQTTDSNSRPLFTINDIAEITIGTNAIHNAVINAPESLAINFDSDGTAGSNVFKIGANGTGLSGATNYFSILDGGNVGIGTTSPISLLALEKAGATIFTLSATGNNDAQIDFMSGRAGSRKWSILGSSGGTNESDNFRIYDYTATTDRFVIDGSGNVGVGTTTPAYKLAIDSSTDTTLQINSTNANGDSRLRFSNTADNTSWEIGGHDDGIFRIAHNDGTKLTIDTSDNLTYSGGSAYFTGGNVGIGTTSPQARLHVYNGFGTSQIFAAVDAIIEDDNDAVLQLSSAAGYSSKLLFGSDNASNEGGVVYDHSNDSLSFLTNTSEKLRVTTAGNVGIGTTTPYGKLSITSGSPGSARAYVGYDDLIIENSGQVGISILSPDASDGNINFGSPSQQFIAGIRAGYNSGTEYLAFKVADAEYMRITDSGNIGIGTTTPRGLLSFSAAESVTPKIRFENDAGSGADSAITTYTDSGGNRMLLGSNLYFNGGSTLARFDTGRSSVGIDLDNQDAIKFYTGTGLATEAMRLNRSGNLGLGTTTPSAKLHIQGSGNNIVSFANSSGVDQTNIQADGDISFNDSGSRGIEWGSAELRFTGQAEGVRVKPYSSTYTAFSILGLASQSADFFQINSNGQSGGDKFVVKSSGNVGIATTSPQAKLQIQDNGGEAIRIDATSNSAVLSFANNGVAKAYLGVPTAANGLITGSVASDLGFRSNGGNILFSTDAGSSAGLYLKNGGNVGIGITNPSYKLQVVGEIVNSVDVNSTGDAGISLGDGHRLGFNQSGTRSWSIDPAGGNLNFYSGDGGGYHKFNTGVLVTGNTGLGTVAPQTRLDIRGTSATTDATLQIVGDGISTLLLGQDSRGGVIRGQGGSNELKFMVGGNGDVAAATGGTEALRIISSGNVGIGTTTPGYSLVVNGSAGSQMRVSSSNVNGGAGINFFTANNGINSNIGQESNGGGTFFTGSQSYATVMGTKGAYPVQLFTNDSARLSIDTSGNIGIGTTSPSTILHIAKNQNGESQTLLTNSSSGSAAETDITFSNTETAAGMFGVGITGTGFTSTGGYLQDSAYVSAGTLVSGGLSLMTRASAPIRFYTNGHTNERMRIDESGNVGIGTTTPGNFVSNGLGIANSNLAQLGLGKDGDNRAILTWYGTDGYFSVGTRENSINYFDTLNVNAGNVGIGTTSPFMPLSVAGDILTSQTGSTFLRATSLNNNAIAGSIFTTGNGASLQTWQLASNISSANGEFTIRDSTAGVTALTVAKSTGNVGIGTTTPRNKFMVEGATSELTQLYNTTTGGGAWSLYVGDNGSTLPANSFGIGPFGSTANSKLVISSTGNVGIGDTSPDSILDIDAVSPELGLTSTSGTDSVRIKMSNTGGNFYLARDGSTGGSFGGSGYASVLYSSGAYPMEFWTNSSRSMVISSGGNVGIGTTTPGQKLSVAGDILGNNIIGSYFTATSTTATSTIAGGLNVSGQIASSQAGGISYQPGNYMVHSDEEEYSIVDDATNSDYKLMKAWVVDKNGSARITFTAYIQAGTYYWAFKIAKNGGNTLTKVGGGAATGYFNDNLASGEISSVHAYRKYQMDVTGFIPGDTIELWMVSSTGGGTPVSGDGQTLYVKEFRVLSAAPSYGNVADSALPNNQLVIRESSTSGSGPSLTIQRSKGGSLTTSTAILSTDVLGSINFQGLQSAFVNNTSTSYGGFGTSAQIKAVATENFSSTAKGTALTFSTTANASTSLNERMRIDPSGYVGIGTTNPSVGNLVINAAGATLAISDTGTSQASLKFYNNGQGTNTGSISVDSNSNNMSILTSGSTRMIVTGSGNVGIGTTSPWAQLSVNPNGITGPAFVVGSSTATSLVVTNGGNIGVGIATPASKLQVSGNGLNTVSAQFIQTSTLSKLKLINNSMGLGNLTDLALEFSPAGGASNLAMAAITSGWQESTSDGFLTFKTSSDGGSTLPERVRITSTGNVGIGTTTPMSLLSIHKNHADETALRIYNTNSTASAIAKLSIGYNSEAALDIYRVGNTATFFINANQGNGDIRFQDGGLDTLTIKDGGNVGIGTTSPTYNLSVMAAAGQVQIDGTNGNGGGLIISKNSVTQGIVAQQDFSGYSKNNFTVGSVASIPLVFGTANTERMRVDISGNVGIGTSTPGATLHINKTGSNEVALFTNTGSNPYLTVGTSPSAGGFVRWNTIERTIQLGHHDVSGGGGVVLNSSGNVGIGTSTPAAKLQVSGATYLGGIGTAGDIRLYDSSSSGSGSYITFTNTLGKLTIIGGNGSASSENTFAIRSTVIPDIDNVYPMGVGGYRWKSINIGTDDSNFAGKLGLASSTPWGQLSVNPNGLTGPAFVVGSSTATNFIISNSGNVGINTSNTNKTLTINGKVGDPLYSASYLEFISDGHVTLKANDDLRLGFAATTYIKNDGKMGIGTSTPWAQLSINPVSTNGTAPAFAVGSSTGTSLIVTNNGNVGVGLTNPTQKLSVNGDVTGGIEITAQAPTLYMTDQNGGQQSGFIRYDNGTYDFQTSNSRMSVGTNIYMAGSVGIGTTTPWAQLSVNPNGITGPAFVVGSSTATRFIVANNGNIGIGTLNPSTSLDVNGDMTFRNNLVNGSGLTVGSQTQLTWVGGSASTPAYSFNNNGNTGLFGTNTGGAGFVGFSVLGAEVMRAATNGFVGIGSTSPTTLLTVSGTSTLQAILPGGSITNNMSIFDVGSSTARWNAMWAGTYNVGTSTWSMTTNSTNGRFSLFDGASGNGNERLSILTTGNVGIGTTTPWGRVSINSTSLGTSPAFAVGSSTATNLVVTNGGNVGVGTANPQKLLTVDHASAPTIGLYTNGTERTVLRADGSGNFSIDTQGNQRFSITGGGVTTFLGATGGTFNSSNFAINFKFGGSGSQYGMQFTPADSSGTSLALFFSNSGGSGVGSIQTSNTDTAYLTSSDRRLKENISVSNRGLEELSKIGVYEYNFINASSSDSHGFIAQELYEVYPYAVHVGGIDASMDPWSVDYGRLTPLIVKSVQDINYKVESLASSTPESGSLGQRVIENIFTKTKEWLASASNGITDFFANRVHTKELCVGDESGETCITKAQLDSLLAGAAAATSSNNGGNTSTSTPAVDTSAPAITINGNNPATITVGTSYVDLGATVSDTNENGEVNNNLNLYYNVNGADMAQVTIDTTATSTHTIIYSAIDQAGNIGTATRIVNVLE